MGLFDSYSQGSFNKLRDGRLAFYPHIVGCGYVVSNERGIVLRRYTTRATTLGLALTIFASFFGIIFVILVASLFLVGYYGGLWRLTRDLERTPEDERLTLSKRYHNQAQHLDRTTLWLLEMCAGLFILAGFYITATRRDAYSLSLGLITIAFFGLCGWAGGYMLWVKRGSNEA